MYQSLLLAMIGCPLMIYKIPLSWAESVEACLSGYLYKWLGVSKNMSNVFLYCDETPCLLSIHDLVTEFEKLKVGGLLQLQQLEDQSVRDILSELYTGKKWKVAVKASNTDSRIKMSKVVGNVQIGTGLGYIKKRKRFNDKSVQGQWSKWHSYIKRDMSWHTLLKSTPRLTSPQNQPHWGLEDDTECALFGKEEASIAHILAGSQKALQMS